MALRDGGEFRFADGREAALRHHVADGLLQHIVDERAEDRRVKTGLLPRFGFEPILQEILIFTGRKFIKLRGRKADLSAVEAAHTRRIER